MNNAQKEAAAWNRTHKRCMKCRYHGNLSYVRGMVFCNYLCIVGHSRGCEPQGPDHECERFEQGKKQWRRVKDDGSAKIVWNE